MPKPRYRQVSINDTPYYHCVSRCVRRAFLCGVDTHTGFNFEHRRQWIVDRIKLLSSVFAIDICAYAVMSNHYHLVIRIDVEKARQWSDREIAQRWMKIFSGPPLLHKFLSNKDLTTTELSYISELLLTWRQRLSNLSWFMRCLNEPIARMANAEDNCTGRFWEGRFMSQALLDERAVLACMNYVDLNPIRAAIATMPEQSDFTSIQARILNPHDFWLRPFAEHDEAAGIPFKHTDYLELVDWGGREIKHNKAGYIPSKTPPILARLGMDASPVLDYISRAEPSAFRALGPVGMLRAFARSIGQRFVKGQAFGGRLCPEQT